MRQTKHLQGCSGVPLNCGRWSEKQAFISILFISVWLTATGETFHVFKNIKILTTSWGLSSKWESQQPLQGAEERTTPGWVYRRLPVPPVVGALGVFLIINIIISHEQVFPLQLVFVVHRHVGADSKAEWREEVRMDQFTRKMTTNKLYSFRQLQKTRWFTAVYKHFVCFQGLSLITMFPFFPEISLHKRSQRKEKVNK